MVHVRLNCQHLGGEARRLSRVQGQWGLRNEFHKFSLLLFRTASTWQFWLIRLRKPEEPATKLPKISNQNRMRKMKMIQHKNKSL